MTLDLSGRLLEGVRVSSGNNSLTFPPRNLITNDATFNVPTTRAEYAIVVDSLDKTKHGHYIADDDLVFRVTKNESKAIRFDYDNFSRRFFPMPGSSPDRIGVISNSPRIKIPTPDLSLSDSPISIYIGTTGRSVTFNIVGVPSESDFTTPFNTTGTVEVSELDGKLNFSENDLGLYAGQTVYATRQSFLDRKQSTGQFGELPQSDSIDYYLFINPKPATGQYPLIRIDYQRHLTPIEVANESLLGSPVTGTFTWSLDTGRIQFSTLDVANNTGKPVYYDGLFIKSVTLSKTIIGPVTSSYPIPAFTIPSAIGCSDPNGRFVIAAELNGVVSYFSITTNNLAISPWSVYVDVLTGDAYISHTDVSKFAGWNFLYIDALVWIDEGVSMQLYRSGSNGLGVPSNLFGSYDFTIIYDVTNQVVESKISSSPFLMLPTNPIVDSSLKLTVAPGIGSTGSFDGDLVDGTDPNTLGYGYLLNLDRHLFNFSNRKSVSQTLAKTTSIVKLDDAAISEYGFLISKNGSPMFRSGGPSQLVQGIDFIFNPANGTVEFIGSIGENDPLNIFGITGSISASIIVGITGSIVKLDNFISDTYRFSSSDVGKYLFVTSGSNTGIYKIEKILAHNKVSVDVEFMSLGSVTVDMKTNVEVIADRFWTNFLPPYKKITVTKHNGMHVPVVLDNSSYNVFKSTGQINLKAQTKIDDVYSISYISLDQSEDGSTTPTSRTENASFKVRGETAVQTSSPASVDAPSALLKSRSVFLGSKNDRPVDGPRKFSFNPNNKTLNTSKIIKVYVGGMPLDAGEFIYKSPNIIEMTSPVQPGQIVTVDYWINESLGGDTNFNLSYSPVDVDTPEIVSGKQTASFNGNQTSVLSVGSAILINGTEVVIVESVSYDAVNDLTTVKFENTPLSSSNGSNLQVTGCVNGPYRTSETSSVDVFSQNTNKVYITGNRTLDYKNGTIITVDGDPFLVRSSKYDSDNNVTEVNTSTSAKKNYVIPSVTRTIRPVSFPNSDFETKLPMNTSFSSTLVMMGSSRSILIKDVDYSVSEGGSIKLSTEIKFGDSLYITYVYRNNQLRSTEFTFNYSYMVSPDSIINGIQGQQLLASYHLYAPDSFFYRIETVESFIPEVQKLLEESATSYSSGPNIANSSSMSTKDYGKPSPYFDESHQHNIDIVVVRLLKHYNDTINIYEDMLANFDGRVVGGNYGKFRIDGNFDNPPVTIYSDIKNDIDDSIKVYDQMILTGFMTFSNVPVYARMGEPNKLSRLFPTSRVVTAAINDLTDFFNFGNTMGSLGFGDIRKVLSINSSKGRMFFDTVLFKRKIIIATNGDPNKLIPEFKASQKVIICYNDGVPESTGFIIEVLPTMDGRVSVEIDVETSLTSGCIMRDVNVTEAEDPSISFYADGKDLAIDFDNGQINNFSLPPPFNAPQTTIKGNELIDVTIRYNNGSMDPARIPVLDGLELNDDGRYSEPLLRRDSELSLLDNELSKINQIGLAKVSADRINVVSNVPVKVGYGITFLGGQNSGQTRKVVSTITSTSFAVSSGFPFSDPIGSDMKITPNDTDSIDSIWNQEIVLLETNTAGPPRPLAQYAQLDSEIKSVDYAVNNLGTTLLSSSGNVTSTTELTDSTVSFTTSLVDDQCLLYISSGDNHGLYKISSVTTDTVTIESTYPFPSTGVSSYIIVNPYSFMSSSGPDFISEFLRETLAFVKSTKAYALSPTDSSKPTRMTDVVARKAKVTSFIDTVTGILKTGERLYDARYLWIQQRTNRETGSMVRTLRAALTRQKEMLKISASQQKMATVKSL